MGNRKHLSVTAVNSKRLLVEWNRVRSYRHQAARQEPGTEEFRNTPKSILMGEQTFGVNSSFSAVSQSATLKISPSLGSVSRHHRHLSYTANRAFTQVLPLDTARYISDLADKATNARLQNTQAAASRRTALPS